MSLTTKFLKLYCISKYPSLILVILCQSTVSIYFIVFSLRKTNNDEARDVPLSEKIYGTLPASLMETKLVVKAVCEDPEVQAARAEVVKSKSVNELSQITSLSEVPIPEVIENMLKQKKPLAPTERKKKFKDK